MAEEFDYIIVDTAPTLLVTDTLLISQSADCTLFVCRVGVTDRKLLDFAKELYTSKKLRNMSVVLNEVGRGRSAKIRDDPGDAHLCLGSGTVGDVHLTHLNRDRGPGRW